MASRKVENLVKAMIEYERLGALIKEAKSDADIQAEIALEAINKPNTKKSFEIVTRYGTLVITEYASSTKADVLSFAMSKLEMTKTEIEAEAKNQGFVSETAGYYKFKAVKLDK